MVMEAAEGTLQVTPRMLATAASNDDVEILQYLLGHLDQEEAPEAREKAVDTAIRSRALTPSSC